MQVSNPVLAIYVFFCTTVICQFTVAEYSLRTECRNFFKRKLLFYLEVSDFFCIFVIQYWNLTLLAYIYIKMSVKPLVSIVTPTYNRRKFIPQCVAGIRAQTYPLDRIEWLVYDDGTDKIADLL